MENKGMNGTPAAAATKSPKVEQMEMEPLPSTSKQVAPEGEPIPMEVDGAKPQPEVVNPPVADGEPDDPMSRPLYALYLDLVLRHVPKRYWRVFRLVCKTWFYQSLAQWRAQMRIKLVHLADNADPPRAFLYPAMILNHTESTTEAKDSLAFLKIIQNPFNHVTMMHHNAVGVKDATAPLESPHWNQFGSWLKTCRLECNTVPVALFRQFVNLYTPQLEELEVIKCYFVPEKEIESNDVFEYEKPPMLHLQKNMRRLKINLERNQPFGLSWMNILSIYPNLVHLTYKGAKDSDVATVLTVIGVIREATRRKTLNLQTFDVGARDGLEPYNKAENLEPPKLDGNTMTQLVDLSLALTHVSLTMEKLDKSIVAGLIETHRPTLTTLELGVVAPIPILIGAKFDFAIFPEQLTTLRLCGPFFEGWGFFCFLPNLQKFYLTEGETYGVLDQVRPPVPDDLANLRRRGKVMRKLSTFHFHSQMIMHPDLVTEIVRLAPNVVSALVNVDDLGLPIVCHNWNKLEHVRFFYSFSEDAFVNNISNLQELRTFRMLSQMTSSDSPFGDRSIFEGFLILPNLHKLQVVYSPNTREHSKVIVRARFGTH